MVRREVVIRRTLASRIFATVFGAAWTAGLATVSVLMIRDGAPFPIRFVPIAMAATGGILFWRQVTSSVKTTEPGVRIRNLLRTITVPWGDIDDIRMVPASGQATAARLFLRNGRSIAMDVLDGDREAGSVRGRRQLAAFQELRSRVTGTLRGRDPQGSALERPMD